MRVNPPRDTGSVGGMTAAVGVPGHEARIEKEYTMPQIPDLMTMLKSGVHFGHQISRRHPKMKPYIFTAKSGFHIINLELTQEKLAEALEYVRKLVANGGTILFLGTKKQAQPIIEKYAKECGMPYITQRWLGGRLTNFGEIVHVIKKYVDLKKQSAS